VESEVAIRRPGTAVQWVQHQAVRAGDGVAVTLRDTTLARDLEQQLRHSQKIDAIGRLASGVAHDFNNMLVVVLGTTEELLSDPEVGERHRRDLMTIVQAVHRGSELTHRLLSFSRRQPAQREVIDLAAVVEDVVELACRAMPPSHTITTARSAGTAPILADRALLEQAVMNLLLNARDAMPGGGVIAVTVDALTIQAPVHHPTGTVAPGDWVRLEVRDAGHGMAPEVVEHIFEPFFTTKPVGQGSGLGLSTAFGIVRQADGHIVVAESGPDGTAMHVYLPRSSEAPAGRWAARDATLPTASQRTEQVILVDDEPEVRQVVARLLRRLGHRVVEFETAEAGLAHLRAEGATLLVTDIVMPGMNGAELGHIAVTEFPDLLVLYISGFTGEETDRIGTSQKRERFLPKPFTAEELHAAVESLVAARRSPPTT
jgi:two-component system cell cycle sensor histidine kinase/response regulator CckA